MVAILAILVIELLSYIAHRYYKVGPNEVLVVTGGFIKPDPNSGSRIKVIKGGGTFVWPIIQQAQIQTLNTFDIKVAVDDVRTSNKVPIDVKANALLRVGSSDSMIKTACEKILGLSEDELQSQMFAVVKGAVRDVLTQITPEEANNFEDFQKRVIESCTPVFENMGLEITNLKITDLSDKVGYFDNLAAPEIAQKKANAAKAESDADREANERIAQNEQEYKIAQLESQNAVAKKNRDVSVAKATYDRDIKRNQAIANKASEISTAEQDAILQQKQIAVEQNKLEATTVASEQANAKAQRINADAGAYSISQEANATAEKIAKIGAARADAQRALADALSQAGGSDSLVAKVIDVLPQLVASQANALASVDKLTVLNGAKGLNDLSTSSLVGLNESLKNTLGIDLAAAFKKRADGTLTIKDTGKLGKALDSVNAKYADYDKKLKQAGQEKADKDSKD